MVMSSELAILYNWEIPKVERPLHQSTAHFQVTAEKEGHDDYHACEQGRLQEEPYYKSSSSFLWGHTDLSVYLRELGFVNLWKPGKSWSPVLHGQDACVVSLHGMAVCVHSRPHPSRLSDISEGLYPLWTSWKSWLDSNVFLGGRMFSVAVACQGTQKSVSVHYKHSASSEDASAQKRCALIASTQGEWDADQCCGCQCTHLHQTITSQSHLQFFALNAKLRPRMGEHCVLRHRLGVILPTQWLLHSFLGKLSKEMWPQGQLNLDIFCMSTWKICRVYKTCIQLKCVYFNDLCILPSLITYGY